MLFSGAHRDAKTPSAAELLSTLEQEEHDHNMEEMNKKLVSKNAKKFEM